MKERVFDFESCPSVLLNECLKTHSHIFGNLLMKFELCTLLEIQYVGNVG